MSILGIIAEYNPFHNGHLYHLNKSKEITGAKFSIAVMGGNFLQRGEPALFDKWTRTKMALSAGIDLVIEIPFVFASQDARGFAHTGIRLLNELGIVDYISFGCEDNRIEILTELANLLNKEPSYFKKMMKNEVKTGSNFPKSRAKAILKYCQKYPMKYKNLSLDNIEIILNQPNNILGLEYLKALKKTKSLLRPVSVRRIGSNYLQNELSGKYSSATAIRKSIIQSENENQHKVSENLKKMMPSSCVSILNHELVNGVHPITLSCFEQPIFSFLRKEPVSDLKKIHGIQEGLENRIKKSANSTDNLESLIQEIKTKRYTRTRIQRILIHSLFALTQKEIFNFNKKGPLYFRILGITENGKFLLKKMKLKSRLPVIINLKKFYKQNKDQQASILFKMLAYDILATDLYVLGYKPGLSRTGGRDFSKSIVLVLDK